MEIYEKTVKKIEAIEAEHAARIKALNEDLNRLQVSIDGADHQRMEALQTGNQKLYSAAMFALDQAKTEYNAKKAELLEAETGPYITKETAEALEADLLAGMMEKVNLTDAEFIKIIDKFYPEIAKTCEAISAGNELLIKINLDMLKDEKKIELYKRTGLPINIKSFQPNLISRYYSQMVMQNSKYKELNGKGKADPAPLLGN